jgi:hypothetical protein
MSNSTEEDRAVGTCVNGEATGRAKVAANNYGLGTVFDRIVNVRHNGERGVQRQQADKFGIPQSSFSKSMQVAEVARNLLTDVQDITEEMLVKRNNLITFWSYTYEGVEGAPNMTETFEGLGSDVGEDRVAAIVALVNTYGAPSSAYNVMVGAKFHENDPRALERSDDEGEDQGDQGESGEDDKTPWQDRLAALVTQATLEGATPSEILAVVNAAL